MELLLIVLLAMGLALLIGFWDQFKILIKNVFIHNKHKPAKKELIEYSNKAGSKYWEVLYNGQHTCIKWDTYEDAAFYYNHINGMPTLHYCYKYSKSDPYYIVFLDKCKLIIAPQETKSEYAFESIINNVNKYVLFMCKNPKYRQSLETMYNNIIAQDYWESKTIMSSEQITKDINEAITNKDIKQLQKLIKEYENTVELSNVVSKNLLKMMQP